MPENADVRPMNSFAVLVDGEYAGIISFPGSENQIMQRLIEGLNQNPTITQVTQQESSTPNLLKIYDVTVGEEYFGKIFWPDTEDCESVHAGLQSNPTILPVTMSQVSGVGIGWIWDGTNFNRP